MNPKNFRKTESTTIILPIYLKIFCSIGIQSRNRDCANILDLIWKYVSSFLDTVFETAKCLLTLECCLRAITTSFFPTDKVYGSDMKVS